MEKYFKLKALKLERGIFLQLCVLTGYLHEVICWDCIWGYIGIKLTVDK